MNVLQPPKHFTAPVQQLLFREILQAMAYPGDLRPVRELLDPEASVAVAVLATLADEAVVYADPFGLLTEYDRSFLAVETAPTEVADLIIATSTQQPQFQAKNGTIYRPEESATVILSTPSLADGASFGLSGPGIEEETRISLDTSLVAWFEWRDRLTVYPQGVDFVICDQDALIAIPRTTTIVRKETN